MIAKSAVFRIESFSCTGEQISLPAHISPSFIHSKLCGATVDDSGYRLQLGEHGECKISCIQCVIECNGQFQVYRGGDKGFCFRIEALTQIILNQLPYRWFYEPRMIHSPIGMNLMLSHVALKALCDAETSQKLSEITHSAWTHRRHMSLLFRGAVGSGAEFVAMAIAGKYDMEVVRIQAHLLYQGATNCSVEKLLTQVLNLSFALCVPTIVIFEDIDALADNSTALQEVHRYVQALKVSAGIGSMVWCFFLDDKQNPSPASLAVEKLVDQSLVLPHRFPRSQAEWKRLVWVVGEYLALSPETIEQGADSVSKVVAEQQQEESLRPVYRDRYVSFATWSALRVQDAWKQTQTLPLRQPLSPVLESWLESESSSTIIIGQENVKQELRDAILLPQLHYETLKTCHVKFETGILLYGPPGTGKTLIVRTLAKELKRQFINISITEVIKGEIGTGEKRVVEIFRQAKTQAPTLVFIDEFQALFTARREGEGANPLSSTLSSCLDDVVRWNSAAGPRHLITVVAATNEPWSIDRGFLRPGRFDRHIFVGPVEAVARKQFITEQQWFPAPPLEMAEVPLTQAEVDELIARTDGCTGAELTHLLQRCKAHALREVMPSPSSPVPTTIQVCKRHWDLALRDCQLAKGNVEKYSSWKA